MCVTHHCASLGMGSAMCVLCPIAPVAEDDSQPLTSSASRLMKLAMAKPSIRSSSSSSSSSWLQEEPDGLVLLRKGRRRGLPGATGAGGAGPSLSESEEEERTPRWAGSPGRPPRRWLRRLSRSRREQRRSLRALPPPPLQQGAGAAAASMLPLAKPLPATPFTLLRPAAWQLF